MAEIRFEGECCECCALVIANGDDSGCRDYYGHTHPSPALSAETVRWLNEDFPEFAESEIPWGAWLVLGDTGEGQREIVGCELCGQHDGYTFGYTFYVIR